MLDLKRAKEIADIMQEYKFTKEQATEIYDYMVNDFLLIEEAIQSYYFSRGKEVPKNIGVDGGEPEKKKRATMEEAVERRVEKLKAQEIKKMRDEFKASLVAEIIEQLTAGGHEFLEDTKKPTVRDADGFLYEITVTAKRK